MADIKQIVHRAAQYLDEWYPGWANKLDGVDYDISNCGNCILHHVEGNYARGLDLYKNRVSSDNWMNGNFPFCSINFDKPSTHAAWNEEIAHRLNVGGGKMTLHEQLLNGGVSVPTKTQKRELVTA